MSTKRIRLRNRINRRWDKAMGRLRTLLDLAQAAKDGMGFRPSNAVIVEATEEMGRCMRRGTRLIGEG